MKVIKEKVLTGERALFKAHDLAITATIFQDGESPLKESRDLQLTNTTFRWKYPLWYAENIKADHLTFTETARSGIWYTQHLQITDSLIQAPKTFRRVQDVTLKSVEMPNAEETFWQSTDIHLDHVSAVGDYFGMNSHNITADHFSLSGNYLFDGAKDIEIDHARLIAKDAFWNCENVVVKNSTITGEYLGWNSKNVTFINCVIESEQGLCYMDNVQLVDCQLINTDLAFEYSTVEAKIDSTITSIKNPISGHIHAKGIQDIIFDDPEIDSKASVIEQEVGALHAI